MIDIQIKEDDEIEISIGGATLTPIPYNSFTTPRVTYRTKVGENETLEAFVNRATNTLREVYQGLFESEKQEYLEKISLMKSETEVLSETKKEAEAVAESPIAKSLMDLVTAKQLGMIRAIARGIGLDADEECQTVLSCKTDELSKKAASAFIQHLQDLEREKKENDPLF